MKKEKSEGDLLHTGTTYLEVHTFKGKDYITVKDFSTTTNALSKEMLELEEENKKLKETIKDHQLYEEKLEHRIIEFEELLHGE